MAVINSKTQNIRRFSWLGPGYLQDNILSAKE